MNRIWKKLAASGLAVVLAAGLSAPAFADSLIPPRLDGKPSISSGKKETKERMKAFSDDALDYTIRFPAKYDMFTGVLAEDAPGLLGGSLSDTYAMAEWKNDADGSEVSYIVFDTAYDAEQLTQALVQVAQDAADESLTGITDVSVNWKARKSSDASALLTVQYKPILKEEKNEYLSCSARRVDNGRYLVMLTQSLKNNLSAQRTEMSRIAATYTAVK